MAARITVGLMLLVFAILACFLYSWNSYYRSFLSKDDVVDVIAQDEIVIRPKGLNKDIRVVLINIPSNEGKGKLIKRLAHSKAITLRTPKSSPTDESGRVRAELFIR